ncbi:MAG TPA: TonB-dependent receptor [Phenylobacterium sp.]|nr:TonB-dependent receptor [Phenylobacterium sp.]
MSKRRVLFSSAVFLSAALGLAATARAETAAGGTGEAGTVDEVVVTALKREANLQDIPASISAISAQSMAERGISDVRDLAKLVPNLNWGEHFGTTLVTIRGVGSNVDSGVTEPTVAMYVDGVFLPRSTMATLRAVDLDRVEVLRGPQGTLYGRNATGGAINFVSAAPTKAFQGGLNLSAGGRDAWGVSGFVSGPVAPGFLVRLSAGREKQDGYVKVLNTGQRLNGVDARYARGAIRFQPSDELQFDVALRYDKDTSANAYQQLLEPSPLAPPSGQTSAPDRIRADSPYAGLSRTIIASGGLTWTPNEALTIRTVSGYVDHKSDVAVDADATTTPFYSVPHFPRPSKSYSHEIDVLGDYGKVSFILGAYYFHEKAETTLDLSIGSVGAGAFGLPVNAVIAQGVLAKIENAALFGDVTYKLTDRLRLNVGLRYNHESNDYTQIFALLPLTNLLTAAYHTKSDRLLPKIALQFDLTDDVQGYAQWSRGYKSGGANLVTTPTALGSPEGLYGPEALDAFEVGLKSQLFDRRITANVAAFYYDYRDLQVTTNVPPSTTLVKNADARVYGVEGDFRFRVTPQFTLQLAPTLTHARFKNFVDFDPVFQQTVDLGGFHLLRAPDFTLNASASYRIDLGGKLFSRLTLQADALYSSKVVLRYYDRPGESQSAYTIGNLSASLANADESLLLSAFVNNVGDKDYKQQITNFGLGYFGNYAPPRTWGVRLSSRF